MCGYVDKKITDHKNNALILIKKLIMLQIKIDVLPDAYFYFAKQLVLSGIRIFCQQNRVFGFNLIGFCTFGGYIEFYKLHCLIPILVID